MTSRRPQRPPNVSRLRRFRLDDIHYAVTESESVGRSGRQHRQPHPGHVPTAIAELVDQFPMPAILVSRYQDVLAANPIAHALSPGFEVGQNLSRCASSTRDHHGKLFAGGVSPIQVSWVRCHQGARMLAAERSICSTPKLKRAP
jgi:hypothetical protein